MTNTRKSELSNGAASAGNELARQMLDGLRRRALGKLKLDAGGEEEAVAIAKKVQANMRLPVDRAAYAIALGYCLAPHFATMKSLVATKAFVVIKTRHGDDAGTVGDVLADAAMFEAGRVAYNPHIRWGTGIDLSSLVMPAFAMPTVRSASSPKLPSNACPFSAPCQPTIQRRRLSRGLTLNCNCRQ